MRSFLTNFYYSSTINLKAFISNLYMLIEIYSNVFVIFMISVVCNSFRRVSSSTRLHVLFSTVEIEPDSAGLSEAAHSIRNGGLVAFPTETVYGLGANAFDSTAINRIYLAKKRPLTSPVIVHVLPNAVLDEYFAFDSNTDDKSICETLRAHFWPGPLTIIHRANSKNVPEIVTAGTGYVGVRSPKHILAQALLEAAQVPIAAPSANRFGHVSPTSSHHVVSDLHDSKETILVLKDDVRLSGGCRVGIESTVCKVDNGIITILRCGAVSAQDISDAIYSNNITLKLPVVIQNSEMPSSVSDCSSHATAGVNASVSPGQLLKHYAPDIPTYVVTKNRSKAALPSASVTSTTGFRLTDAFVIDFQGSLIALSSRCATYVDLSASGDPTEACATLFETLRMTELPAHGSTPHGVVLLPDLEPFIETNDLTRALWDRLIRAASGLYVRAEDLQTET